MHAACPTHCIPFDFITLMISDDEYGISSLRNNIIDDLHLLGFWLVLQIFFLSKCFVYNKLTLYLWPIIPHVFPPLMLAFNDGQNFDQIIVYIKRKISS